MKFLQSRRLSLNLAAILGKNSLTSTIRATSNKSNHFTFEPKMSVTEVERKIIELYKEGKWEEIIDLNKRNSLLPWIWPTRQDLNFIGERFRKENGKTLVSIGCGSGLLEWLLSKATGIDVIGIELDKSWWTSKYACQIFIPVFFSEGPDKGHQLATSRDAILLFCYFNNEKAFVRYIEDFKGHCFIVIGPGPEKFVYTVPQPFLLPENVRQWKLNCYREIGESKDYIAVYFR